MKPVFPTGLHQDAAEIIKNYFSGIRCVDTVLVVNSCARGQAVAESDLDFAILVEPHTSPDAIKDLEYAWEMFSSAEPTLLKYGNSNQFAHLHLDIIEGNFQPAPFEKGGPVDYFEVEIGNQIRYSAPLGNAGIYFHQLQKKWLPYYDEDLRLQRLEQAKAACNYDLEHIPFFMKRELYFQAFDILYKAFQEYLQALFIANTTYPIAYNKWIKEQVVKWLNMPDLYPKLAPILSVNNLESNEINNRAITLKHLLNDL
jgi:predicted nucleotidyltransferase